MPAFIPGQPMTVPTKTLFLRLNMIQFLVSLLFLDMIGYLGRDASMKFVNLASSRVPFFRGCRMQVQRKS